MKVASSKPVGGMGRRKDEKIGTTQKNRAIGNIWCNNNKKSHPFPKDMTYQSFCVFIHIPL